MHSLTGTSKLGWKSSLCSVDLAALDMVNVLNEALVDSHLKGIPGPGTLSAGGLAGGDLEGLGWEADWALDAKLLALGTVDELGADLLQGLDVLGSKGDADLVGFLCLLLGYVATVEFAKAGRR